MYENIQQFIEMLRLEDYTVNLVVGQSEDGLFFAKLVDEENNVCLDYEGEYFLVRRAFTIESAIKELDYML